MSRILHISNSYTKQKIYSNLIEALSFHKEGLEQVIYVPLRNAEEVGKNNFETSSIQVIYDNILKPSDRLLFHKKINKLFGSLTSKVDCSKFNLCHAHFLFSDGSIALKLKSKYGIPYVVAIRNTDINVFMKFGIHLKSLAKKILLNSERIIIVTPSYKAALKENVGNEFFKTIQSKIEIIPNGIDEYWSENIAIPKAKVSESLRFLYVGDFSKNKNVPFLIRSILEAFPKSKLDIVGGGGRDEDLIIKLSAENPKRIHLNGRITKKDILKQYYRTSDILCLISKKETFGMSTIEALSQGTPIIITKNQGVDGFFNSPVGKTTTFQDLNSFIEAVNEIVKNYPIYSTNGINSIEKFKLERIAKKYINIYDTIEK